MDTIEIEMQEVESSQICAIGHDPETNTLAIRFKKFNGEVGNLYHYANFTAEKFAEFKESESAGKFFGEHIKKQVDAHPFTKIEDKPAVESELAV